MTGNDLRHPAAQLTVTVLLRRRHRWFHLTWLDRSPQQPRTEQVEDPREAYEAARPREDEDQAQNQGDDDAGEQHLLLVLPGTRKVEGIYDEDNRLSMLSAFSVMQITEVFLVGWDPLDRTMQTENVRRSM